MPNGDRIDLGADGNTPEAATSPAQMIQVIAPNGPERFQQGETVNVQWRSDGLLAERTVVFLNVGGGLVDNWHADRFRTAGESRSSSFTNPVDTSLVTNPAPQAVYQTLSYPDYTGIGQKVAYQIPVSDGSYTMRLHFVEPWVSAANQRKFDIKLQGTTVRSNFDIYAAAGARYRAVAFSFSVNAAAGAGLLVEVVNTMSNAQAILSGIEILQADTSVLAYATATIDNRADGAHETLSADTTGTAITASYDSVLGRLALTGPDSRLNFQQVLRTVSYVNAAPVPTPGDRSVAFVINDGFADREVAVVTVSPPVPPDRNDPPWVNGPASVTMDDDGPLVFSGGNQVSVDDYDARELPIEVELYCDLGAVSLSGTTGLTFLEGDGDADAWMVFRGTPVNINAALYRMAYQPEAGFLGDTYLNDLGQRLGTHRRPAQAEWAGRDSVGRRAVELPAGGPRTTDGHRGGGHAADPHRRREDLGR